jgi:hypothetical protein
MITVHHVRDWPAIPSNRDTYCGRRYRQLLDSPLANRAKLTRPITFKQDGKWIKILHPTRDQCIQWYSIWLKDQQLKPKTAAAIEMKRLFSIACTGDLRLYCWCVPKSCHCDVIKAELEARL